MDLRRILERWALTSFDHRVRITFESICAGCNLQISVMLSGPCIRSNAATNSMSGEGFRAMMFLMAGFDNGSSVAAIETQSKKCRDFHIAAMCFFASLFLFVSSLSIQFNSMHPSLSFMFILFRISCFKQLLWLIDVPSVCCCSSGSELFRARIGKE